MEDLNAPINTDDFKVTITYTKPYRKENILLGKAEGRFIALPELIKERLTPDQNAEQVYKEIVRQGLENAAKDAIKIFIERWFD